MKHIIECNCRLLCSTPRGLNSCAKHEQQKQVQRGDGIEMKVSESQHDGVGAVINDMSRQNILPILKRLYVVTVK